MREMEFRRALIRVRYRENLGFFKKSTQEGQRHRRAVVAESIWKNHCRVSREIRRNELIQIRRAGRSHDHIDLLHQFVPSANSVASHSIRVHIISRGNEARGAERIWPIEFPL